MSVLFVEFLILLFYGFISLFHTQRHPGDVGHTEPNPHLDSFSSLRRLHCPYGRPLPGFWAADGAEGRARAGRPVRVQPQHPEAAELPQAKRRLAPRGVRLRGLGVLQPDPASEERRPRGAGEDRGPAGHDRIQGDPLHLQRHLPVRSTGQEITGAQPGSDNKDWFVPRLLDSKEKDKLTFSLVRCCFATLSFIYTVVYNVIQLHIDTTGTEFVLNIFDY